MRFVLPSGVVLAIGALSYPLVTHPPSNSSEWASWFQAIGSVAAIVSVIWLAQSDARKVDDERKANAEVTGIAIWPSLTPIVTTLRKTSMRLETMGKFDGSTAIFADAVSDLGMLSFPTEDQLLRLVAVPGQVSRKIAHVEGQLLAVKGSLSRLAATGEHLASEDRRNEARQLKEALSKLAVHIEAASDSLSSFLKL